MSRIILLVALAMAQGVYAYGVNDLLSFASPLAKHQDSQREKDYVLSLDLPLALVGDHMKPDKITLGSTELGHSEADSFTIEQTYVGLKTRLLLHERFLFSIHGGYSEIDIDQNQGGDFALNTNSDGFGVGGSFGAFLWESTNRHVRFGVSASLHYFDTEGDASAVDLSFFGLSRKFSVDVTTLTADIEAGVNVEVVKFRVLDISVDAYGSIGLFQSHVEGQLKDISAGQDLAYEWIASRPLYLRGGVAVSWANTHLIFDVALGGRSSANFSFGIHF